MRPIQSEQLDKFAPAFLLAQRAVVNAPKDAANPHFKSRFTSLTSVSESCKGALHDNGITVIQNPFPLEDNNGVPILTGQGIPAGFVLRTVLMHESGQFLASELPMCPVMSDPQKVGSALTYARRYALAAMAGVCPEDDDAEAAMGRRPDGNGYQRDDRPRQEQPQSNGTGHHGPPRTGKALFAWVKEQEQKHEIGLLKYLNNWAKLQEFPGRMVDWDEEQVALAVKEAERKIRGVAGDDQPKPANGHTPKDARSYEQLVADAAARCGPVHATTLNRELLEDAIDAKLVNEIEAGKASADGSEAEYTLMKRIHADNPGWVLKRLIEKVNAAHAAGAAK